MTETLFIRLGSKSSDAIQWLILSGNDSEIIASGDLENAKQLTQLSEKSKQRLVKVFVSSSDIALKRLTVPGSSQRAIRSAAPYMLEDELAQDVEQLFFAYSHLSNDAQGHNCFVAVVEREQLQQWLSWLADADIECKTIIPDVLVMPLNETAFTAVEVENHQGNQMIVRQGQWQGFTVDSDTWHLIAQRWTLQNQASLTDNKSANTTSEKPAIQLQGYSTISIASDVFSEEYIPVEAMPEELPLLLLAQHSKNQLFNLLQGEFQVTNTRSKTMKYWLWAAVFAVFALLMNVGYKGVQLIQLTNQQQLIEGEIIRSYKRAFPESKRVRVATIKSQLKQKLAKLGGLDEQQGFLTMLEMVEPAFKQVPQIKPESLKFDSKRQELRLQAIANDYQYFDQFKIALERANLKVKQGAQNNQGDQVVGSFSISYANGSQKTTASRGRS